MKSLAASLTLSAALAASASAADLPRRAAPPPVFTPVPVFTWTGFYAGINAGYDFDHSTRFVQSNGGVSTANSGIGLSRPPVVNATASGFTGGGQIGYNYQFAPGSGLVIGFEADAAYTDINRTRVVTGPTVATTYNTFRGDLDYLGTVRGRVGYAFDRVLIYGTGGFAYGGVTNSITFFNGNTGLTSPRFNYNSSSTVTGYVGGGGVEFALPTENFLNFFHSSAVTAKVEYLYYELAGRDVFILPVPGGGAGTLPYASRISTNGNIVRAGLNYKFGSF
jgi:outer membrane immunogenic protein